MTTPDPVRTEPSEKQIQDIAFAVLRKHNDDRLWRALTFDSGPYDVTTANLALCDLARAFWQAALSAPPPQGWQKLVLDHNQDCIDRCDPKACGYEPYFEHSGRRCPACPFYEQIEIPPELAASPPPNTPREE